MDRYPSNPNSQLIREAKIGFSIVLLVVSTVGFWAYSIYSRYRTQIPDHVRNAPIAKMVGPDEYLSSLENRGATERLAMASQTSSTDQAIPSREVAAGARQVSFDEPIVTDPTLKKHETERSSPNSHSSGESAIEDRLSPLATETGLKPKIDLRTTTRSSVAKSPAGKLRNPVPKNVKPERHHARSTEPIAQIPEAKSFQPRPRVMFDRVSSNDNRNDLHPSSDTAVAVVNASSEFQLSESESNSFQTKPALARDISCHATKDKLLKSRNQTANQTLSETLQNVENLQPSTAPLKRAISMTAPEVGEISNAATRSDTRPANHESRSTQPFARPPKRQNQPQVNEMTYIVKSGDSLWTIATEFYDDGRYFRALRRHNRHLIEENGDLKPGIQIAVPDIDDIQRNYAKLCPVDKLENRIQSSRHYVTVSGDTLFGIARQEIGQASRYLEIFELNRKRLPSRIGHLTRLPADIELILPR